MQKIKDTTKGKHITHDDYIDHTTNGHKVIDTHHHTNDVHKVVDTHHHTNKIHNDKVIVQPVKHA